MGKITRSEGFTPIPEGTHIFKIVGVVYKEDYGKLEIKMKTAEGQVHIERFSLISKDGIPNEGALNAFSYFARTALNDYTAQDVAPEELVGYFIECDVEHELVPSKKDPEKTLTFTRLTDKRPANGYDKTEVTALASPKSEVKTGELNLDALLD